MSANDRVINDIYRKIERERSLIQGAKAVRLSTANDDVRSRCDSSIRESMKNIEYLEKALQNLQAKRSSQVYEDEEQAAPATPAKDSPAKAKEAAARDVRPSNTISRARPNYTELDLIKYDSPYLGPRIQLMLQQLEFKLSVEKQYKEGIDKLVRLYQMEGDRRNKQSAENKRLESNQKVHLLRNALKRYQDMHIDLDDDMEHNDLNSANIRRPLTGKLHIGVTAIKDVDHAAASRFRAAESFVVIKVEDQTRAKTKVSRNDRWAEEFDIDVDKANEAEITVYDKVGDREIPIGMTWIRISDIAEEQRRKRIENELSSSGWVSAEQAQEKARTGPGAGAGSAAISRVPQSTISTLSVTDSALCIEAWFVLEPAGQIRLRLNFAKHNRGKRPLELGKLGRQGAIRQKREEVHMMYGHKFIQQQFYNVMQCAFCGEFLKYSVGYQCEDCKFLCHKKCFKKVITKCISKSNSDTDPDEEKLNHRIPHRFEPITNISANWCCHCGYILPLGKRNVRKCTECGLTCHAHCAHLVPDFCGMSMEMASKILWEIKMAKHGDQIPVAPAPATPAHAAHPPLMAAPNLSDKLRKQTPTASPTSTYESAYNSTPSPKTPPSARTPAASPYREGPEPEPSYSAAAAAAAAMSKIKLDASPTRPLAVDHQRSGSAGADAHAQAAASAQSAYTPERARYSQVPPADNRFSYYGGPQTETLPAPQLQQSLPISAAPERPGSAAGRRKDVPARKAPKRKIGLDDFNFLAVLGKGNFGKVMLAEAKRSQRLYAIKVLKKEFIIENGEVESTRSEKRVYLTANKERHPFLLNLHSCFQTETRVYFVMEYISGGDLMLHIQREQFSAPRAQFYAAEVLLGLKYFHDNGIVYRDLKLDNIMLTLDGHIKIADYGLCKENMWFESTTGTFCGTPEFMAPEIIDNQKYTRSVDWWAFGVLIYQMLLGQSPFRGDDEEEIFDSILSDEPLYPIHMARESVSILQQLLTRDPWRRLGSGPGDAEEVMAHPYFANINFDDIYHKRVRPPFVPTISSPTDTSNFDQEFTREVPVLTPVTSVLSKAAQEQFRGFSYMYDEPL
ncbi:uncharacterized protein V1510DRAFT_364399 [Dipodascopsis tothii]|uniref:uncharacterized protein n=1 Tax=Dipodascopsis tothii TaxID=44089 RepID=UPI0034CDAABE